MTISPQLLDQLWHGTALTALKSKAVLLASSAMGLSNFFVAEIMTGDKAFAIMVSTISVLGTAYFTARPRIIAAHAAREMNRQNATDNAKDALILRLETELETATIKTDLIRISKHSALDYLDTAQWHIYLQQQALFAHKIEPIKYERVAVREIFGHEDDELLKFVQALLDKRAAVFKKHPAPVTV